MGRGNTEEESDAFEVGELGEEVDGKKGRKFVSAVHDDGGDGESGVEVGGVVDNFFFGFAEHAAHDMPIEGECLEGEATRVDSIVRDGRQHSS